MPAHRLGCIIRDIRCKIEGNSVRKDRLGPLCDLACRFGIKSSVSADRKSTLHAPEVECIG